MMNFECAKENIQPLAAGRNVEQLEVALNAESQHECQEELLEQRRQYELAISNYTGEDPLEVWFEYIGWVEQSYPKSGKESALDDLLKKCLSKFEKDSRYAQDPRFIRLFIKYIDSKDNPNLYYTKLYNGGVGTMVADLYIAWAHYFDVLDDFDQAKAIYQKGLDARAAPIEHLKQVYERFQFSVGQRVIRKDEYRQEFLTSMEAQRNAFTSLRSLKRSKVGSVRTGNAVKSFTPGQVRQNQSLSSSSASNAQLQVYDGESQATLKPAQPYRSVVEEIENSMVENKIEPGPWSKPSSRKGVFDNVHGNSTLKFAILEDDIEQPPIKFGSLPPDNGNFAIKLPKNFVRRNDPQTPFVLAAYVEPVIELHTMPAYQKFYLHPNENICFQPEELRQYHRLKQQNISNNFTESREKYWGIGATVGARVLRNFVRQNEPQTDMETERPDISLIPSCQQFECNMSALYPKDSKHELQFEEIMKVERECSRNNAAEMDVTVCVRGRQSFGVRHTRKSIVTGGRKSIMPVASDRDASIRKFPAIADDSSSDMDLTEDFDVRREKVSGTALIDKVEEFLKPTELPERQAAAPANKDGEFKRPMELPKITQWSVFTDDEPNSPRTPELMTDKPAESPAIFSRKNVGTGIDAADKSSNERFAIPQRPLHRAAEKRTTESVSIKHTDTPLPARSPYPIGPHTGAVKKSILRKSSVAENAIENSTSHAATVCNSDNNAAKLPSPDLDYSLCTQAFNVNLVEQMASTPVQIRRTEPLTEQLRLQDIQQAQPLKLSTIMETTEGSGSAASTKSSTQFSSPEDDDLSKRSNVMNRTKFVGLGDEATEERDSDSTSEPPIQEFSVKSHRNNVAGLSNYSCNVEKTLPAIQLSLLPDATAVAQKKNEVTTVAATKDGPTKTYPFPIFEDTQTLTTMASMSPEPKDFTVQSRVAFVHQSNDSAQMENSTALQDVKHPFSATVEVSSNNSEGIGTEEERQMDACSAEDSFARPNIKQPFDGIGTEEARQMDDCATEDSFALPNVKQPFNATVEVSSNNSKGIGTEEERQTDDCSADDSFALPNVKHPFNTTVEVSSNNSKGIGTEEERQTDDCSAEDSFALPNVEQPFNTTVEVSSNNFEEIEIKEEQQTIDSISEESFAPLDSSDEIIEVPDETLWEDPPNVAVNRFETSTRISISFTEEEMAIHANKNANGGGAACDQSIYFKQNSILMKPSWTENQSKLDTNNRSDYQHEEVNLEESRMVIDTKLAEKFVDPFSDLLKGAILADLRFMERMKNNQSCDLISTVPTIVVKRTIPFKDSHFDVVKCIGHGAYGRVYNVKWSKDGSTYAVKKEMPANLWEYYILQEVRSRVVENFGYMKIDMAIIANDGSLLFSQYSQYGSLLDVCNRVFTSINHNVNESIVFILAYQMLDLVDRLHKADILHLDLKPDNFLVMRPMSTNHRELFIQLIDFGNAVDLRQYPAAQQFNAALETKHFVCLEMLEKRPWIFQPDLFCLAGTIHSVLFGRYLDVKMVEGNYRADVKIPRYFNPVWSTFFQQLINIPEGGTSPNLQSLKECFEGVIVADNNLPRKVAQFNGYIN